MYYKNVVRRSCARLLMLGVVSLMYYGNLLGTETATLRPNGDITTQWSTTGTPHWEEVNEGFPADDADYIYTATDKNAYTDKFNLTTQTGIVSCSQIKVEVRAKRSTGDKTIKVKLFKPDGTTQIGDDWDISGLSTSWATKENTWSSLTPPLTQTEIEGLQIELTKIGGGFWSTKVYVSAVDVVITYIPVAITVTDPDGGESWLKGTAYNVTWTSAGVTGNVNIELWKGGSKDSDIITDTPNDGLHSWSIPPTQPLGADYKVRITSVATPAIWDESNGNFSIGDPSITVEDPDGGEVWGRGLSYAINWTSAGVTGNVDIDLYKTDAKDSDITPVDVPVTDGSYSWDIPPGQALGADYEVRITSVTTPSIWDESNAKFSIGASPTAPTLLECENLTNPTDVTDLTPGFTAQYNDPGDIANKYQIQVSTDNTVDGDGEFTNVTHWNSGETSMDNVAHEGRCSEITYVSPALARVNGSGNTYYWQIRFWDDSGLAGAWSAVAQFTMKAADVAGVYYVRKDGKDGNVGTDNTSAKAWLTINEAATNMTVAGDIVYVGTGTYEEQVSPQHSGSDADNLISYIADPQDFTVIVQPPNENNYDGFDLTTVNYIKIEGFDIDGSLRDNPPGGTSFGIDISADELTGAGIVISKNSIHDFITYGIKSSGDGSKISNNSIYSNFGRGIYVEAANVEISENTIYNNTLDGIMCISSASHLTISHNAIYSNGSNGIHGNADFLTISNNLIYSNATTIFGHSGISDPGSNSTISNNTIYSNDEYGIYIDSESDITISNNIITNNPVGIYVIGNSPTLSYNDVWNNTTDDYSGCSAGTGCLDPTDPLSNPLFVDPDGADNILGGDNGADDDFHLKSPWTDESPYQRGTCTGGVWGANAAEGMWTAYADECSPCIDSGNPLDSYSLEPEPNADRINMGAFGNTAQASLNCEGYYAIELISFDARPEKDYILLNWITEAEINNSKWLIKRAETKDAGYEQITELHAQGVPNNYIYIDSLVTPGQSYWYKLGDVDKDGSITWHGPVSVKAGYKIKFSFSLKEPASNPSTGKVKLEYSIPGYQGGKFRPVTLKIYNISGQVVKTLVDERQKPGHYTIWWDGKNEQDKKVGSGTYFCHFKANGELTRKLIHIK